MTDIVQDTLRSAGPDGVVLFTKSYCPYCKRAKDDLRNAGVVPIIMELDQRQDGQEIQTALMQMTGQRTVPSAWVRGQHIGGSDDVHNGVSTGLFGSLMN
eukprot:scaffold8090_cov82-Cylindrotheca_fusiformis.AAC.4